MGMFLIRAQYVHAAIYIHTISLQCKGQDIEWSQLRCLYKRNRTVTETPSLAMLHKVKYEHVYLTSFSKMRVDLAAQVHVSSAKILYMYVHVFCTIYRS